MKGYLENMVMDVYADQVVINKEESSGDELQDERSSSAEEEDELEEEKNENEDIDNNDNEHSNSYSSALTTMDWGLRSHPDYQEDYWIGDSVTSSHMWVRIKISLQRLPFKEKLMLLMVHQCPWCAKVR